MEEVIITKAEFKNISKLAENIYNIATVVEYFCTNKQDVEELYNLSPVIKNLLVEADNLNAFFINFNS